MLMRLLTVGILVLTCSPAFATALNVALVQGPSVAIPYDYTGNGNGFVHADFEINNPHTVGLVLLDITLTAIGTGDDSVAFAEVGLFVDDNSNGAFDPVADTRYGQIYAAYPVNDGSLTFAESLGFAPGEFKRFFIVVKMNGAVVPPFPSSFRAIVSAISATGGAPTGVPTGASTGMSLTRRPVPLRLDYEVTGSAPPYYYDFRLVLDNHDGSWSSGQEWSWLVFGQAAYEQGGTAPFVSWVTDSASYPVGPFVSTSWASVTYFVVPYDGPMLGPPSYWQPAFVGDQLTWGGTANVFLDEGEMTWSMLRNPIQSNDGSANLEPAYRVGDYLKVGAVAGSAMEAMASDTGGGNGFAIGAFDVVSHTNSATLSSLTIEAGGSGDDSAAFSEIRLFVDSNANGTFEPGVDTPFGQTYATYPSDDGTLTFTDTLNFNPNEIKRILIVAKLNGPTLAAFGQTFNTTVTAISATGNMHSGLPTAVMPGIHIEAPTLTVLASGAPQSVQDDAQGPGGMGVAVAEFLLSNNTVGTANLDSISVAAAGMMYDQADFSLVALYEDANSSGDYDAPDTLYGSSVAAFPADDGTLTFTQSITFAPGQSRLFLLVVKLGGAAEMNADFWSRITALGVSGGTEVAGAPSELIHGLTILPSPPRMAVSRGAPVANGGTDTLGAFLSGVPQMVTYTIANTGDAALDLPGTPSVAVSGGANVISIGVTAQPATTIGVAGSTTFTLTYTIAAAGAFDFAVSIDSTDPVNNPYIWTATGSATSSPGGNSDGGGDEGGCSTNDQPGWWWLLVLLPVLAAARTLRRPTSS
jgi:hypothetical protein